MNQVVLLKYGEIHLKGKNRPYFEKKLFKNLQESLQCFPGVTIRKQQGRYYVENIQDFQSMINRLNKVFGFVSYTPAIKVDKEIDQIKEAIVFEINRRLAKQGLQHATFRISAKRADKTFHINSMEMNRFFGDFVLDEFENLRVDVHRPQINVRVEVRESAYIYSEDYPAAGGMPVGTNGKATLLLSGGIDSPVAGWMIAKRGVALEAVHFHSFPYTSDRAKEKVFELCKKLVEYTGRIRLHVVPFTQIQETLYKECPDSQITILMRRYKMRIAEKISENWYSIALITGESIGQVASQTIESLTVTNAVVNMPVFRPLIGFDKVDIMRIAEAIDTYETSILPYEDCCTVFTPKHPVTKPKLENILKSEALLTNAEELIDKAILETEIVVFEREN
jgi:thiamine biosynthesis protein ThiI